jgi:hypothetical protein
MSKNNFTNDLKFGNKYEEELLKHLRYDSYEIMKGYFKPYDIIIKDNYKEYKIEVKSDRLTHKTGNICIESECNGKQSGISTTEADAWAYFEVVNDDKMEYNLYIIPTNIIKKAIKNIKYSRCLKGGDNYKSKFYLFNKNIFDKYLIYKYDEK